MVGYKQITVHFQKKIIAQEMVQTVNPTSQIGHAWCPHSKIKIND